MQDSRVVFEHTSQLIRESAVLRSRASKCLSTSAEIIDKSRRLLAARPVRGTPALNPGQRAWETIWGFPPRVEPSQEALPAPKSSETAVERIEGQKLAGGTVRLDGKHFVDCTLQGCVLEYWGGQVVLEGTQFSGCRFSFFGEAAMTVAVLDCFDMLERDQFRSAAGPAKGPASGRIN